MIGMYFFNLFVSIIALSDFHSINYFKEIFFPFCSKEPINAKQNPRTHSQFTSYSFG